ncbi:DNA-directed RNA polymerase III subunit RPC10, partial [Stegodyphus mimosarum]
MLMFCPTCANILVAEDLRYCFRFACSTCPYTFNVKRRISSRSYPKLKEIDDVLGGAAAWENVESTEETCPKCGHTKAYFFQT